MTPAQPGHRDNRAVMAHLAPAALGAGASLRDPSSIV